jgi:GntR family transcriptional regulator, transcriptional repressor for pyruvate dehydrogenase complex
MEHRMLKRDSLVDRSVKEILSLIFRGTYGPGKPLPGERVLCQKLGVSRDTLRQCLARLQALGVIQRRHGSATRVRRFSHRVLQADYRRLDFGEVSLDQIIFARTALEAPAAELACGRITPQLVRRLEQLLDKMSGGALSLADFIQADMEFHRTIVQAGSNRVLLAAFDSIYEYHKYSQVATSYLSDEAVTTVGHHRRILAAIKAGRPTRAATEIREHMNDMKRYVRRGRGVSN